MSDVSKSGATLAEKIYPATEGYVGEGEHMEIYVFDDKMEEVKKAEGAIISKGHVVGRIAKGYNLAVTFYAENIADHSAAEYAQNEIAMAIEKMKAAGGGIITDMMFHLTPPLEKNDPAPPSGLLVVIQALTAGVPVVVCTDADEVGGHHAQALHWIFDGYVMRARNRGTLPFGWIENKDWDAAVNLLEQINAKQKEGR